MYYTKKACPPVIFKTHPDCLGKLKKGIKCDYMTEEEPPEKIFMRNIYPDKLDVGSEVKEQLNDVYQKYIKGKTTNWSDYFGEPMKTFESWLLERKRDFLLDEWRKKCKHIFGEVWNWDYDDQNEQYKTCQKCGKDEFVGSIR